MFKMLALPIPESLLTGGVTLDDSGAPYFHVHLRDEVVAWCHDNMEEPVKLVEEHKKVLLKQAAFSVEFGNLRDLVMFKLRWI